MEQIPNDNGSQITRYNRFDSKIRNSEMDSFKFLKTSLYLLLLNELGVRELSLKNCAILMSPHWSL